jgi:hypothetical protein
LPGQRRAPGGEVLECGRRMKETLPT